MQLFSLSSSGIPEFHPQILGYCLWEKNLCFRTGQSHKRKGTSCLDDHIQERPLQHVFKPEENTVFYQEY